jgi:hypothetical protein
MRTSIAPLARRRLSRPARKLAIELLFAGLAIVFVLAIPRSFATIRLAAAHIGSDRPEFANGGASRAENARIKTFMERVALSYTSAPRGAGASVVAEAADRSRPAISAADGGR